MKTSKLFFNKYKKNFIASTIFVIWIFSLLLSLMLLFGTNDILDYIKKNVEKIDNRELEFGIDEQSGYYYVKNDNDAQPIKVLQLSDIHLSCGILTTIRDKLVVDAIIKIVKNTKPDIIVLTGDSIYPSILAMTFNNYNSSRAIGMLFEKFEIPWAIIYGNHDASIYGTQTKTQLSEYFSTLPYCLFQKGPLDISGQGNYIVKLLSSQGELESALILMDSNSYIAPFEYDFVHDDQVTWYSSQIASLTNSYGEIVPTHLFLHIPLYEFNLAWKEYLNGGDDIIYHYGTKDEKRIASAKNDRGKLFNKILELGSTKTVFSGHDHTHNFSITYKGVRLTYGMSMDYTAYVYISLTNEYRGGTLLQINTQTSYFDVFQVPQTNNFLPLI